MTRWPISERHALLIALTLSLLVLSPDARSGSSAHEGEPTLSLVPHFTQTFEAKSDEELRTHHDALIARMLLDGGRTTIEGPQDLHDVIVLEAIATRLRATKHPPDELAISYLMDVAGHLLKTRPKLVESVEQASAAFESRDTGPLVAQLRRDIQTFQAIAQVRFPKALALKGKQQAGLSARDHHLHARFLNRQGRLKGSLKALKRASSKRPTPLVLIDEVDTLIRLGQRKKALQLGNAISKRVPALHTQVTSLLTEPSDEVTQSTQEALPRASLKALFDALDDTNVGATVEAFHALEGLVPAPKERLAAIGGQLLIGNEHQRLVTLMDALHSLTPLVETRDELMVASSLRARLEGGEAQGVWRERTIDPALQRMLSSSVSSTRARGRALAAIDALLRRDETRLEGLTSESRSDRPISLPEAKVLSAAWLNLGKHTEAFEVLEQSAQGLDSAQRQTLEFIRASLQLALGHQRGDRAMVSQALRTLDVALADLEDPLSPHLSFIQVIGRWVAGRMGIKRFDKGEVVDDQGAYRELIRLVDLVDPLVGGFEQIGPAAALSAGSLALGMGKEKQAIDAFRVARRLNKEANLSGLLDGWTALVMGDPSGALLRFERAAALAPEPRARASALKWAALSANRAGDAALVTALFGRLVQLWDIARLPKRKLDGRPTLHGVGGIDFVVRLNPQGLAEAEADIVLIPMLFADFPHDRSQIEGFLRGRRP
jgi:tetratricopeptide (TPR) repeat protein